MKLYCLFLLLPLQLCAQEFNKSEIAQWEQEAGRVTIIRDNWGIPHVYGKTDADCVFGMLYSQCEDDFKRVELNYVEKLGRLAEINGEKDLYSDLLIRMVIDSSDAVADYKKSPEWLQKLMNAYADGINYYLYKNPAVKPALLHHFKPWYTLLWTDGSISAINTGGLTELDLKNFYSGTNSSLTNAPRREEDATGSNGFAFAPSRTASGNAILYINPHVTFYFRNEVQMTSEEGLNTYGAVTWGQFFVYQGFNDHCGWMHTTGYSDVADLYTEQIVKKDDSLFYKYDNRLLPVQQKQTRIYYKSNDSLIEKKFTIYSTHHGPIMAMKDGKWISVKANNRSLNSLMQSWRRDKCKGFEEFRKNMELRGNCSNNTIFADAFGNIAFWHGNFIPRRDTSFDWTKPLDGTIKATEWKGLHEVDETVHVYNPATGWIQNCNSTPFTVSGSSSPKKENYPSYMAPETQNFRDVNAGRLLAKSDSLTIEKVIALGYDTYLSAFENLVPALIKAYENASSKHDSSITELQEPIAILKKWDLHSRENSVATTLAIEWGQRIMPRVNSINDPHKELSQVEKARQFANTATDQELLLPFLVAVRDLSRRYGNWQIPWGDINRYQRLTGNMEEAFDDQKPSLPVGMAGSNWGCLPSFASSYSKGSKMRYGYNGNSFICAVEFGKRIKAKSLLTGGENGNPSSKHFSDQALMYTKGQFKDVWFYKEDVLKHAERTYHPGE